MLGDEASYQLMKKLFPGGDAEGRHAGLPRAQRRLPRTMNRIKMNLEKAGKPIPGEAPKDKAAPKGNNG